MVLGVSKEAKPFHIVTQQETIDHFRLDFLVGFTSLSGCLIIPQHLCFHSREVFPTLSWRLSTATEQEPSSSVTFMDFPMPSQEGLSLFVVKKCSCEKHVLEIRGKMRKRGKIPSPKQSVPVREVLFPSMFATFPSL